MATAISCFFWFQSSDGSSETSTDQEHVGFFADQAEFRICQCEILNPPIALMVGDDHVVCSICFQLEDVCCSLLPFEAWSALVYILLLYLKFHAPLFQRTRYLWTFGEGRGRSI